MISKLIEKYKMEKHPEGGWYSRFFQSEFGYPQNILPSCFSGDRYAATAIYYLLEKGDFSAFHSLFQNEIWHFHMGGKMKVHVLRNGKYFSHIVSSDAIVDTPTLVLEPNDIFGAEIIEGNFAFVSCTVSPGFNFDDFKLHKRSELIELFPNLHDLIVRLTR